MRNLIDSVNHPAEPISVNFLLECEAAKSETAITEFFVAYGRCKIELREGRLDEAGFWKGVAKVAGAGFNGIKNTSDALSRLKVLAQSTGPVAAFDEKADQLLNKIKGAAPDKVITIATKYVAWAKANPVKQGLIVGVLTPSQACSQGLREALRLDTFSASPQRC